MLIEEIINETLPGAADTNKGFAKFRSAAKQKLSNIKSQASEKLRGPEKQRIANQNRKKWIAQVKKLQKSGKNMADENVYRSYLHKFLSGNNRLKLSRDLKIMIGRGEITNDTLLDIMTKTIDDRIAAKQSQNGDTV